MPSAKWWYVHNDSKNLKYRPVNWLVSLIYPDERSSGVDSYQKSNINSGFIPDDGFQFSIKLKGARQCQRQQIRLRIRTSLRYPLTSDVFPEIPNYLSLPDGRTDPYPRNELRLYPAARALRFRQRYGRMTGTQDPAGRKTVGGLDKGGGELGVVGNSESRG